MADEATNQGEKSNAELIREFERKVGEYILSRSDRPYFSYRVETSITRSEKRPIPPEFPDKSPWLQIFTHDVWLTMYLVEVDNWKGNA
jgi:hypothetical protein